MIALRVLRLAQKPALQLSLRRSIISSLFRKKNAEEQQPKQPAPSEPKKQEGEREMEDDAYNFFERRREVDTDVDFSKLRQANAGELPERLGEGGVAEVLYWSQHAVTPHQVQQVVAAFNRLPVVNGTDNAQLQRFKASVVGSVYLVDSLSALRDYAVFGLRWGVGEEQFWEKVQFKGVRFAVGSGEEAGWLVDIVFAAGQFQAGEELFNYTQKVLADHSLTAQQYIKLFLVFSALKSGEKPWIQKLLRGIADRMGDTDAEQLSGVLSSLKQAKKLPVDMNKCIQEQVQRLLPTFTLPQLLEVSHYFGFEMEDEAFWGHMEARAVELLSGKEVGSRLLEELVLKAVLSYRLSTDFVRRHIVPHCTTATLDQLPPRTLSALSKGLYIYELEKETSGIEEEISRLLIGKISQGINEISDGELVGVIQDYNLTRHGARELYIFFEEVIKVKFLRNYNPEVDRNTIELLASIYDNSGMCSRDMLDSLNNLILE